MKINETEVVAIVGQKLQDIQIVTLFSSLLTLRFHHTVPPLNEIVS